MCIYSPYYVNSTHSVYISTCCTVRNGIKQKANFPNSSESWSDFILCVHTCLWFCLGFVSVPGVHPSWLAALLVWPKWISAKLASTEPNCPKLPQSHCQYTRTYSDQGLLHSKGGADNLLYLLCCVLCAVWDIFSYPPSQRYVTYPGGYLYNVQMYMYKCARTIQHQAITSCICICIDSSATVESGCDKNWNGILPSCPPCTPQQCLATFQSKTAPQPPNFYNGKSSKLLCSQYERLALAWKVPCGV